MRGTLLFLSRAGSVFGIIPAYAGNTASARCASIARRDHPRVCGEHLIPLGLRGGGMGSSPRMRGTLGFHVIVFHNAGIIPAYAGNTWMP